MLVMLPALLSGVSQCQIAGVIVKARRSDLCASFALRGGGGNLLPVDFPAVVPRGLDEWGFVTRGSLTAR